MTARATGRPTGRGSGTAEGATVALASVLAQGFEQDVAAADHIFRIGLGSGYASASLAVATTPVGLAEVSLVNGGDIVISAVAEASVTVAATGTSDVDLTPLRLVADAFLLGRRNIVDSFED